jgi:hypothetical protein
MNTPTLAQLESEIQQLTFEEQIWLLERLAHQIRERSLHQEMESQLAAMAADPDIQREISEIQSEFVVTEPDGLSDTV